MAINKAALKKQLHALGIKTYRNKKTQASYVKKSDVAKVLAKMVKADQDEKYEIMSIKSASGSGDVLELKDSNGDIIEVRSLETNPDYVEGDSISGEIEYDDEGIALIENIKIL